ncbi:MAG: DUF4416 family protein [Desulfobacterales bacterium]
MSRPQPPKPAKLVIGFFLKEKHFGRAVIKALVEKFGPVDMVSSWLPFDFTTYYNNEMGTPLFRRLAGFKQLIQQRDLPQIKLATNAFEHQYSFGGKRSVNIDPGYLLNERFVLATGKNYSHRIYIGKGIYADLTLIYTHGRFEPLPWTYPDYASDNIIDFLEKARKKYRFDTKQAGTSSV